MSLAKLTEDLAAKEETNVCLQGGVECLKESVVEERKVVIAVKNDLATTKAEL